MFEQLFQRAFTIARHKTAPYAVERERYLEHYAKQEHDQLVVRRYKQRYSQLYPLVPAVGDAIVRYLKQVRPECRYREVFITLLAPRRPMSCASLYSAVARPMQRLGIKSLPHRGPHALRYVLENITEDEWPPQCAGSVRQLLPVSKEAWRGLYRVEDLARIYVMVGEHDAAIEQLELLFPVPVEICGPYLRIDPVFRRLSRHPRFEQLARPCEAQRAAGGRVRSNRPTSARRAGHRWRDRLP